MAVMTDGLTNSKILATSDRRLLTGLQKQVRFLMDVHLVRKPCPNCGEVHSVPEAAGVENIDDYDFGKRGDRGDRIGPCRACKRTLIYVQPIVGDWHWSLDPAEAKV